MNGETSRVDAASLVGVSPATAAAQQRGDFKHFLLAYSSKQVVLTGRQLSPQNNSNCVSTSFSTWLPRSPPCPHPLGITRASWSPKGHRGTRFGDQALRCCI